MTEVILGALSLLSSCSVLCFRFPSQNLRKNVMVLGFLEESVSMV